jgi:GAF domain-containing protein
MELAVALRDLIEATRTVAPSGGGPAVGTPLLQSVVDAAATLFEAEAASIALYERDPDRLEFLVAAGPQGAGVVGLSVPPTQGVVGFVFSTGQSIALSDVTTDPRFDRETAERTGYLPCSIAAVPLAGPSGSVGVLQVLDKRGSATFSLKDMTLLGAFAHQASLALQASRVARDAASLLRQVLAPATGEPEDIDERFARAAADLDDKEDAPFWRLVDHLASLAQRPEREQALVADLLAVVVSQGTPQATYHRRGR